MFDAIFWDNDGVLVDTEKLYLEATKEVLLQEAFELTRDHYIEHVLIGGQGVWHLAEEQGIPLERIAELRAERDARYEDLLRASKQHAIDGIEDALRVCHGRFDMGVVTSSRRDHFDIIHSSTGFCRYFDFIISGDDVSVTKPYPEPYLKALDRAGVPADRCIAIEDTRRGLLAAKAAGLTCWVIPNELSRGCDFSPADAVLENVQEAVRKLFSARP